MTALGGALSMQSTIETLVLATPLNRLVDISFQTGIEFEVFVRPMRISPRLLLDVLELSGCLEVGLGLVLLPKVLILSLLEEGRL